METHRDSVEPRTTSAEVELVHENENNYEILNSAELRAKYITLTDGLISRLIDSKTEVAIFLDKSARPVAWLVDELWDTLSPTDPTTGETYKRPQIKFLNIDREQWGPYVGRSEDKTGGINVNRIPSENINQLRGVYAPVVGQSKEGDETLLTGKNVLVIDEVRMSGDTLHMAERILQKAFPDANAIDGAYWMPGIAKRDPKSGALVGGEVPVWYDDEVITGRLVANRDSTKSSHSNSSRQRIGAYWLSTRFRKPDMSGRKLKAEVKQLAQDLVNHKMPYMPAPSWSSKIEQIDDRIERIDGISLEEYAKLRKEAPYHEEFIELYADFLKAQKNSSQTVDK